MEPLSGFDCTYVVCRDGSKGSLQRAETVSKSKSEKGGRCPKIRKWCWRHMYKAPQLYFLPLSVRKLWRVKPIAVAVPERGFSKGCVRVDVEKGPTPQNTHLKHAETVINFLANLDAFSCWHGIESQFDC